MKIHSKTNPEVYLLGNCEYCEVGYQNQPTQGLFSCKGTGVINWE